MSSPIRALIWHEWRLYRWVVAAASVLYVCGILFAASDSTGNDALECGLVVNSLVTLAMIGFLGFWRGGAQDLNPGFPARMLTLPVRTSVLTTTLFSLRIALVAISAFVGLTLPFLLFGAEYSEFLGVLGITLALAGLTALFLAATWFFSALGPVGNTAMTFAVALPLALAGVRFLAHMHMPNLIKLVLLGAVPAGYAAALVGVALYRSGRSAIAVSWVMETIPQRRARRARSFASPAAAQTWFEWRRSACLFPFLTLALAGMLTAPMLLSESQLRRTDWALWFGLAPLWLLMSSGVAAGAMGALTVLRDHADRASGLATFSMTRPISTAEMAKARLRAGLRSVGLTALLAAILLLAVAGTGPGSQLRSLMESPQFVRSFILGAGCGVLGVWVLYWLAVPLCLGWGFFTLLYVTVVLAAAEMTGWRSDLVRSLETAQFLWVPTACVVLALAAACRMAAKRRLVSSRAQVVSFAAWLAIVIPSAYVYYGRWTPALATHVTGAAPPFVPVPVFAFCASLTLLAFAPLAAAPLWLTWWRHR